jgi:recombination protein RecT
MTPEFATALPSHIKAEKFQRVVMTVVQQQPELLSADRATLLAACTKCAADGLIPDGREAALVIFNTKKKIDGKDVWVKAVQYMPMLGGILKRARNSGEIAGIIVNVVHEADEFMQRPDDFERPIEHRPPKLGVRRGNPIGAYALVKLKDGTVMHDVMDRDEIERVRAVSRSKDSGPWVQWWDQMARKTVFRRLSKYLPMDAEAEDLMRRDDEIGTPTNDTILEGRAEPQQQIESKPSKLDALEGLPIEEGNTLEGEVVGDDGSAVTDGDIFDEKAA